MAKLVKSTYIADREELSVPDKAVVALVKRTLAPYVSKFYLLGFILLCQAGIISGSIILLKYAVDQYFEGGNDVFLLLTAIFLSTVGKSLFDYAYAYIQNVISAQARDTTITNAFSDLLNLPFAQHVENKNNKKYRWVIKDSGVLIDSAFGLAQVWIKQPIHIASSIGAIAVVNWKLTILGLIVVPLVIPFSLYFKRKTGEFVADRKLFLGRLEELVAESIYAIRIIKVFGLEPSKNKEADDIIGSQRRLSLKNAFATGMAGPVAEALGMLSIFIIIVFGSNTLLAGDEGITAGTFLSFMLALFNVYRPFKAMPNGALLYQTMIDAGRRLLVLAQKTDKDLADKGSVELSHFSAIDFKDVGFSYSSDPAMPTTLSTINFTVQAGESVLLAGVSGAGKSTLCDLLFRLYQPQTGVISIDGVPLNEIKKSSLSQLFAICSQESIIFNDSLYNNILLWRSGFSREEVLEAARVAHLPDRLMARMDDLIGDRGLKVSGGERQRVALARAILQKPQLLVLDEALNNLDPDTEFNIWQSLKQYLPNATFLVVSHRWFDFNQYDRMIVISNGRLVENIGMTGEGAAIDLFARYRDAIANEG